MATHKGTMEIGDSFTAGGIQFVLDSIESEEGKPTRAVFKQPFERGEQAHLGVKQDCGQHCFARECWCHDKEQQ